MPETADPYEQAEQELVSQGRPKPKGDAWLMSIRDALIALAVVIPLELVIAGEGEDIDTMWLVVIGVGAASYVIRYNSARVWWGDLERRATMIAGSDLSVQHEPKHVTEKGAPASGHCGCIATEVILQATTGRIHDRTRL
jgi:hypothetical protein